MQQAEHTPPECILLAGAGGGLGMALHEELSRRFPRAQLLTISHTETFRPGADVCHLEASLAQPSAIGDVTDWLRSKPLPDWVIHCSGVLHWQGHGPEKNLQQCTDEALLHSISINVLTHLHLAQALAPLLQRRSPLTWASLSAKVGSIEDNQLGGWYSYRMSKAALNMLVRNLSIEWGRKLDTCRVVAIHPGTTDTALSKPFQQNIPADKLYPPGQSADRIVSVLEQLSEADNGKLLFWDGTHIPW
ncbi:SDR family oxidoreductase [Microbulbifer aggregans]|uniref:SDR family oxidoreductase n=1 Tax=Microbulbifer aggregans TaxID=1769779 RepID=UPI001CFF3E7F|nr:SDR family oxidoreductase [Microbulbifer aggregans]